MKQYLGLSALFLASAALAVSRPYVPPVCPAPPSGFFVSGNQLFKPDGSVFAEEGVNWSHWDSPGAAKGIPNSGANTVRMGVDFKQPPDKNLSRAMAMVAAGLVPMPSNWGGTCKSDVGSLTAIVDTWVVQAATWTQLNNVGLINIANEWGPANSIVWRDEYIKAVARMRAAGYTSPLVIDSGGCGQDVRNLTTYAQAVLDSDPQKNIMFSLHVYGNLYDPVTASWQQPQSYVAALPALKATGLHIIFGEFGPGHGIGPSPTQLAPERVIADARANGFGFIAWAWDDNNMGACQADDHWFSMTTDCGRFSGKDSELTTFGKTVLPLFTNVKFKPAAVPAAPVGPVLTSSAAISCKPNYSCAQQLAASSPAGKVTFSIADNDKRIGMTSTGLFSWWTSPVAGIYPTTVVLTDSAGNITKVPVTLTVGW